MSGSAYMARPDAELEGLAAGGDSDAFAELYNRHFDRVYDFSLRILRDRDEAADIAQETFLKAMAAPMGMFGLRKARLTRLAGSP